MRDMNADRASMMKNRPLRNREDEDRECARALNQRNRDAQCKFRDARNDGSNRDSCHSSVELRFNLSIVATANLRSHPVTKKCSLVHSPEYQYSSRWLSVVFSTRFSSIRCSHLPVFC
jgi:hypothetical protein